MNKTGFVSSYGIMGLSRPAYPRPPCGPFWSEYFFGRTWTTDPMDRFDLVGGVEIAMMAPC